MNTIRLLSERFSSIIQGIIKRLQATRLETSPLQSTSAPEYSLSQPNPNPVLETTPPVSPETEVEILKQKLSEMQKELNQLKESKPRPIDFKKVLPRTIIPLLVLLLTAIPQALVIKYNWLGDVSLADFNRGQWWCKSDFLCQTALPSFFILFLLVFLCW